MDRESPSTDALRKCGEWLANCLNLGWEKSQLDELEALWWTYHDSRGALKVKE